jgi:hypothetical protein
MRRGGPAIRARVMKSKRCNDVVFTRNLTCMHLKPGDVIVQQATPGSIAARSVSYSLCGDGLEGAVTASLPPGHGRLSKLPGL